MAGFPGSLLTLQVLDVERKARVAWPRPAGSVDGVLLEHVHRAGWAADAVRPVSLFEELAQPLPGHVHRGRLHAPHARSIGDVGLAGHVVAQDHEARVLVGDVLQIDGHLNLALAAAVVMPRADKPPRVLRG